MESDIRIEWPAPPEQPQLGAGEVHVWAQALDQPPERVVEFVSVLPAEERARVNRFHFERDRSRYGVARGWLRRTLGSYVGQKADGMEFEYGARGKPRLAPRSVTNPVHFNLAHSGGLALLAVTRVAEVGVDVERVRTLKDAEGIADRFFSKRESAGLKALAAEQQPEAFFNLWTRKEAWLKATGEGIAESLSAVEVSFLAGEPAEVVSLFGDAAAGGDWSLLQIAPARGFIGAVALKARGVTLRTWKGD
jgi:4'-phosphopantetheinyl transferase